MTPTRILPDLQCSLVCEEIRQEVNGNFILIGVINFIRVPKLPVTAFRLCVVNRWTAGLGQFTETIRLIGPDQTTVLRKGEVKFTLQDAILSATNVTLLQQVEFKSAGAYYIEVLVDDRDNRPGVMFADADLLGVPHQLVVGERGLEQGIVEYRERKSGDSRELGLDDIVRFIVAQTGAGMHSQAQQA